MTTRAKAADAGCWIDGHWGQYGVARMVEIAATHGYGDETLVGAMARELTYMGPNMGSDHRTDEMRENDGEILMDGADGVEAWLNDNVAPGGFSFGWHDGEFFLWSTASWEEEG